MQNFSKKQRSDWNHQNSDSIQTCRNRESRHMKIHTNQPKLESNKLAQMKVDMIQGFVIQINMSKHHRRKTLI